MPKVRGKGDEAKRHNVSLRVTPAVMAKLDAAIAENGRSLAQELERRVSQSFEIEDELGGPEGVALHRRIAWAIKRADEQAGSRWTESPTAFWSALGAIEGALEELHPPYSGEDGELVNRHYFAKEQAQQGYDASYEKLKARFPVQTTPNALARALYGHNPPPFEPQTVADYRYDHIMTDEELSEAVTGMEPADEALVREHQEKSRALRMAEIAWKTDIGALFKKEEDARQRAKDAVRRERRHIIENQPATRI